MVFLLREAGDLRSIVGEDASDLPLPQRVFLEDEEATPVLGFPVLQNSGMHALRGTLENYLRAEQDMELAVVTGRPLDQRPVRTAWEDYQSHLNLVMTNAISSSFGRGYPSIFWLYHSIAVARGLKEIPMRVRELHLEVGKRHGVDIKYRIFNRYLDRVLDETYAVVQRAAAETDEEEEDLFPRVLSRMRDNVLILTEDHIGPDLREVSDYFRGYLRGDAADFRRRLEAVSEWHFRKLEESAFRLQLRTLLQLDEITNPWSFLVRPGYLAFLAGQSGYSYDRFPSKEQIDLWNGLLFRLKEFELLASLRRYVLPVREDGGLLKCAAAAVRGRGRGTKEITLSYTTRPLDYTKPWVVDPLVQRFGLIYDITDFSSIVSILRRSGSDQQDTSFQRIFGFQRRINKIARAHKLQLEKYLGDGALYSGRHPTLLLAAAVRLQRFYGRALQEDFPFDRGMRIALNYGQYRLLPIEGGSARSQHRYEFFGHGIVELSRLVTGKATREMDEVKTMLVSHGYSPTDVERFFEPVVRRNLSLLDAEEEGRPFTAYVRSNGTLVNEGIVATRAFMKQVSVSEGLAIRGLYLDSTRRYVILEVEDDEGTVSIGIRKLGEARLKGLENAEVFEVVDARPWMKRTLLPPSDKDLLETLEEQFRVALRSPPKRAPRLDVEPLV
jgi:hypothetical protein